MSFSLVRRAATLSSLVLLVACVAPVQYAKITAAPQPVSVLASVNKARLTDKTQPIEIRTITKGADGKMQEVTGAKCKLTSDELRGEVMTPQAAVVPTFKQSKDFAGRGLPSGLVADCTAGKLKGRAISIAQEKQASTATGGGLGVALITLAVTAAVASSTPWNWPPTLVVELK